MVKPVAAESSVAKAPSGAAGAMRPRVLHVMGGAGLGGMERQLLALLPYLAVDTEASLLLVRGGELAGRFADVVPTRIIDKYGKLDPICLARMVRTVRSERPDIVHSWGSTANLWGPLAARIGGAPHLVMSDVSLDAWKGRALRAADRWTYGWADVVTGKSTAVVRASITRGAPADRTAVIPNGVLLPSRPADPAEREPGLVLYLGRLHPDKGPDLLVAALAAAIEDFPTIEVLMAGPAQQPVERRLAAKVTAAVTEAGLDGRVRIIGPVADPVPLLRRAGLLVLPSRTEGSPNVVLEAMAHGTPVVATAVGGVPELLGDGRLGRLVAPDDAVALGRAIAEVLRDPASAADVAARARACVEEDHSMEAVSRRWVDIYRRVTSNRGD